MPTTAAEVTKELLDWIRAAAEAPVAVRGVGDPVAEGIDLRLLNLTRTAVPRTVEPPSVLALDYLLTVRCKDPFDEHRLAADLMFAALKLKDVEVLEAPSAAAAAARLGMAPAAGFVIRACLSRERAKARAPLVRFPLVARTSGLGRLEGQVRGPGATPIAGATAPLDAMGREAAIDELRLAFDSHERS